MYVSSLQVRVNFLCTWMAEDTINYYYAVIRKHLAWVIPCDCPSTNLTPTGLLPTPKYLLGRILVDF